MSSNLELEAQILAHVGLPGYRPIKPLLIAKRMGLAEAAEDVRKAVKRLIKAGQLKWGASHQVMLVEGRGTRDEGREKAGTEEGGQAPGKTEKPGGKKRSGHSLTAEALQSPSPQPSPVEGEGVTAADAAVSLPTLVASSHTSDVLRSNARAPRFPLPASRSPLSAPRLSPLAPGPSALAPRPSAAPGHVAGVFRRTQAGFGFVRTDESVAAADRKLDVFIPADRTLDAATGDTVLVRLQKQRDVRRPNPTGEIVEVIERETHQFVGTYFESAGSGFVQVDGTLFSRPVLLGDPGAKNAQPDDKVVFEMIRFPSHVHDGEGVITEVLGARGAPGVDALSIIREFNLPEAFADDALEEARRQAEGFDEKIGPDRVDLTEATIITIDPIDARDFDDAISLERIERDHWRLGVHIADVSHFVRPRSALDREALHRGTSVYLPDRVIPMLPEIISNGLASLQPDRVRYTKTVFIEFTPDGAKVAADPQRAAIRSRRRFTYEEVDEYLADPEAWRSRLTPEVHLLLGRMHELGMILRARRFRRGSLELTLKEVKVDLDREGRVAGAHVVQNTASHQIIEEFMLSANEAVAELLQAAGAPFLRRVHADPDPRKLKALDEFVAALGFQTESLQSRFALQKLLEQVAGRPEQHAVNYAVLRSMQRAIYSPQEEGHYALASDCYGHFTSPIRRYPDLTIHRQLDQLLRGKKPSGEFGELVALGEHCSEREQRAASAERELTKLKLLLYMQDRVGEEMDGVVTGVEEFGLFVEGINLPAEGLIRVAALADDFYHFDRTTHSLTGRRVGNAFRLGDRVRVSVARVDVDRRELDFRLVVRHGGSHASPRAAVKRGLKHKPAKHGSPKRPGGKPKKRR